MMWEALITVVVVGCCIAMIVFVEENDDDTSIRGIIYYGKVMYGLLSFPFIVFNIPLVISIIADAKPTMYDKYGVCVPYLPDLYKY